MSSSNNTNSIGNNNHSSEMPVPFLNPYKENTIIGTLLSDKDILNVDSNTIIITDNITDNTTTTLDDIIEDDIIEDIKTNKEYYTNIDIKQIINDLTPNKLNKIKDLKLYILNNDIKSIQLLPHLFSLYSTLDDKDYKDNIIIDIITYLSNKYKKECKLEYCNHFNNMIYILNKRNIFIEIIKNNNINYLIKLLNIYLPEYLNNLNENEFEYLLISKNNYFKILTLNNLLFNYFYENYILKCLNILLNKNINLNDELKLILDYFLNEYLFNNNNLNLQLNILNKLNLILKLFLNNLYLNNLLEYLKFIINIDYLFTFNFLNQLNNYNLSIKLFLNNLENFKIDNLDINRNIQIYYFIFNNFLNYFINCNDPFDFEQLFNLFIYHHNLFYNSIFSNYYKIYDLKIILNLIFKILFYLFNNNNKNGNELLFLEYYNKTKDNILEFNILNNIYFINNLIYLLENNILEKNKEMFEIVKKFYYLTNNLEYQSIYRKCMNLLQ
ncbi:hypothetical protein ABK040_013335 [Willaertia magna]